MRWITLTLLSLLAGHLLHAQRKVTIEVFVPSSVQAIKDDTLYIAGSFNNWNPKDRASILLKQGGSRYVGTVKVAPGSAEFKITRGSWSSGESDSNGSPRSNRLITVRGDTLLKLSIAGWADHFLQQPRKSTASKNVRILSDSFYLPQLNRYRRVWIYLPQSYGRSRKKYPVLYMHDGQNLFDDSSSFSGEWGIDEALDSAGRAGELIVVGIDHGGATRLNEYGPYDMGRYGKGEGAAYAAFLTHTLRPYIDRNYRTKRRAQHRYIAGSSMGGLISLYTVIHYPKKWGAAGVFSPAFWIAPRLQEAATSRGRKVKSPVYFYAGKQESESMVPDMLAIFNTLRQRSKARMQTVIRSNGGHNEATWRQEFPLFLHWLNNR